MEKLKPNFEIIVLDILDKNNIYFEDFFKNPGTEYLLDESKSFEEKKKIIEGLPYRKTLKILSDIKNGNTKLENLSKELQIKLEISLDLAEKVSKEIEENVFNYNFPPDNLNIQPKDSYREEV